MIQRRAVSSFSVRALVVVALSSVLLFGCGASDDPVEGVGQPPLTSAAETRDREIGRRAGRSETGVAVTSTSAQTAGDDATSDQGSDDIDSGDGESGDGESGDAESGDAESGDAESGDADSGEDDHEDDFGVSSAELEELERTLDEIDQLIADLERDLAAD